MLPSQDLGEDGHNRIAVPDEVACRDRRAQVLDVLFKLTQPGAEVDMCTLTRADMVCGASHKTGLSDSLPLGARAAEAVGRAVRVARAF